MIGSRLAHYTVVSPLGAGGMGEVWRATDSKLGRDVALKLLPAAVSRDPERLARFQREAQVLASLNHPHIGAIYGFETVDDVRFLVLELVEGPTLADRLAAGPVPVDEALRIALQIAEAVEAAHERGIVHRDLKPANVKVTPDGRVKVLDFGLAKALVDDPMTSGSGLGSAPPSARGAELTQSPTISPVLGGSLTSPAVSAMMTGANVILGTAAYMAPEQARGQAVDRRADIWAMGVILYEMLTGQRLFAGETISDTLAAVLKTEPDWSALPAETPARVRRLLRRALVRNPRERLRDAGDARILLREAIEGAPDEIPAGAAAEATAAPRPRWQLPLAAVLAAALAAGAMWALRPAPPEPPTRKFVLPVPGEAAPTSLALAPDASALAVVTDGRIEIRDFVTGETRRLESTQGAEAPFWSPDGDWIAFGNATELRKVRRTGGESSLIAALNTAQRFTTVAGGEWGEDGRIVFASGNGGIYSVSSQGGEPQTVAAPGEHEQDFHELATIAGGKGWLTILHGPEGFDSILAVDPQGKKTPVFRTPGQSLFDVRWSPSGHIVFRRTGASAGIWALPYSPASGKPTGEPFLISAEGSAPTIARDGTLAYRRGMPVRLSQLAFVDREGNVVRKVGEPGEYLHFPALSPDGSAVAIRMTEAETRNLWFIDVQRGSRRRFTTEPESQDLGVWDSSGKEFWYVSGPGTARIRVRAASGVGEAREVTEGDMVRPTPDGTRIFFARQRQSVFDLDLWTLDLKKPDAKPEPFVATEHMEIAFDISPTDPLIAYASEASGRAEIYLTTYPDITNTWLVSTTGGSWPVWRHDGRELFYACADSIFAVDVQPNAGRDVRLGAPRLLFRRPDYTPSFANLVADGFDVTADGSQFLVCIPLRDDKADPTTLVVVQNWAREFRAPGR